MISIIITAKNELRTIGRAVRSFLNQDYRGEMEIIVIAPDQGTLDVARQQGGIRTIQDDNKGKYAAMNLSFRKALGDILIFSDGDVEVERNAVRELLEIKNDMVSGRPESINSKQNIYGWWQYALVDTAHRIRARQFLQKEFVVVSGYLFSIKKNIIQNFQFPKGLLAEDEYLSYWVWKNGYSIGYAKDAIVKVKYPNNYKDWVRQKIRTLAGGYQIPRDWKTDIAMRSFSREIIGGLEMWLLYIKSFKHVFWLGLLFWARLHVWIIGFIKVKLLKQNREKVWVTVKSTK